MSAHVLLNLLNELSYKGTALHLVQAPPLFSIFHITLRLLCNLISGIKKLRFCHYVHNAVMDFISKCYQNL